MDAARTLSQVPIREYFNSYDELCKQFVRNLSISPVAINENVYANKRHFFAQLSIGVHSMDYSDVMDSDVTFVFDGNMHRMDAISEMIMTPANWSVHCIFHSWEGLGKVSVFAEFHCGNLSASGRRVIDVIDVVGAYVATRFPRAVVPAVVPAVPTTLAIQAPPAPRSSVLTNVLRFLALWLALVALLHLF